MQDTILVLTIQHGRLDNNEVAQTGGWLKDILICLVHLKPGQTNVLLHLSPTSLGHADCLLAYIWTQARVWSSITFIYNTIVLSSLLMIKNY